MRADGRHPLRAGALVALTLAGCAAPSTIETSVGVGLVGESIAPGVKVEATDTGLVVSDAKAELARGPAVDGQAIAVALAGQPCTVTPGKTFSYDETDPRYEKWNRKKVGSPDLVRRTFTRVPIAVKCSDGPVPGTTASLRGADPRRAFGWLVPSLIGGVAAGSFVRGDRKGGDKAGLAALIILVAVGYALGVAWSQVDRDFAISMSLAGVAAVIAGIVGGRLWDRRKGGHVSMAWLGGFVVGALPLVLATARWSAGGPIAAVLCGAAAAIVASVIAVSIKPLV